jgi:hypothetical protein
MTMTRDGRAFAAAEGTKVRERQQASAAVCKSKRKSKKKLSTPSTRGDKEAPAAESYTKCGSKDGLTPATTLRLKPKMVVLFFEGLFLSTVGTAGVAKFPARDDADRSGPLLSRKVDAPRHTPTLRPFSVTHTLRV